MTKICLNSRDELALIDLDKVAYLKANGNYCDLVYICGQKQALSLSLSKLESVIRIAGEKEKEGKFIRLGRSLIINNSFLIGISVLRQRIILSDCDGHSHTLEVPKIILKKFKAMVADGVRR